MATVAFSDLLLCPRAGVLTTSPRLLVYLEFSLGGKAASTEAIAEAGQQAGSPTRFHATTLEIGTEDAAGLALALRVRLKTRGSDLDPKHAVVGQGLLPTRDVLVSEGPLRVELFSHFGLGTAVGTLRLCVARTCIASLLPPSPEAVSLGTACRAEQGGAAETTSNVGTGSPDSCASEAVTPLRPYAHEEWASSQVHLRPAWGGYEPPGARSLTKSRRFTLEDKSGMSYTLQILGRCKLALMAADMPLPADALPQSGWRGVKGTSITSWKQYVQEEQLLEQLPRLGVSKDVLSLMDIADCDEDSASGVVGYDPLAIARNLTRVGLAQEYGPLYHFVYGRTIAEAMKDLPPAWKDEDKHMVDLLGELEVDYSTSLLWND